MPSLIITYLYLLHRSTQNQESYCNLKDINNKFSPVIYQQLSGYHAHYWPSIRHYVINHNIRLTFSILYHRFSFIICSRRSMSHKWASLFHLLYHLRRNLIRYCFNNLLLSPLHSWSIYKLLIYCSRYIVHRNYHSFHDSNGNKTTNDVLYMRL